LTFYGNAIFGVCRWGISVTLAKIESVEMMIGQLSLGIAIATPITNFSGMNLREVMVTDAKGAYEFGEYVN
jgi:hypothetical protein